MKLSALNVLNQNFQAKNHKNYYKSYNSNNMFYNQNSTAPVLKPRRRNSQDYIEIQNQKQLENLRKERLQKIQRNKQKLTLGLIVAAAMTSCGIVRLCELNKDIEQEALIAYIQPILAEQTENTDDFDYDNDYDDDIKFNDDIQWQNDEDIQLSYEDKKLIAINNIKTNEDVIQYLASYPEFCNCSLELNEEQYKVIYDFLEHYDKNEARYKAMEEKTGVPAYLIAAIHYREGSGSFDKYIHNGTMLGNEIDVWKKEGDGQEKITLYTWEDSVIDSMERQHPSSIIVKGDYPTYLEFAEKYNGYGYRKNNMKSPYIWSGTDTKLNGKFESDGIYNKNQEDKQLGIAVLLRALALAHNEGEQFDAVG